MIGQKIVCENEGCDIEFTKRTHNQRYHDDECCRLATNAKIMAKYYEKRARQLGHARYCSQCQNRLSRYNSSTICNSCQVKAELERNSVVSSTLASINWLSN